jgi:hypothetical protein
VRPVRAAARSALVAAVLILSLLAAPGCAVDSEGDPEWQTSVTGPAAVSAVAQTSDGGYVAVGSASDGATGDSDIWLMKLRVIPP